MVLSSTRSAMSIILFMLMDIDSSSRLSVPITSEGFSKSNWAPSSVITTRGRSKLPRKLPLVCLPSIMYSSTSSSGFILLTRATFSESEGTFTSLDRLTRSLAAWLVSKLLSLFMASMPFLNTKSSATSGNIFRPGVL